MRKTGVQRLNLPAQFVGVHGLLRPVVADQNLQLRNTVRVLEFRSRQIDVFALEQIELVQELLLDQLQVVEEAGCLDLLTVTRLLQPEVLPDAQIVADAHADEVARPLLPDKLAVGHQAVNAVPAEEPDEALDDLNAFGRVAVPPLGQQPEQQLEGHVLVGHAEQQDVDVGLTVLPVGAVHGQHQPAFNRQQREYHASYQVKVQRIACKGPLQPAHVGLLVHCGGHGIGQPDQVHGLRLDQGLEQQRHQFDARQVHGFSQMLLHDRKKFANFAFVLGISSFLHRIIGSFSLQSY